jgi:adenylate kinase
MGPPGAGKGTHAKELSARLAIPHISSGDIFRGEMATGTELGEQLKKFVNAGQLVPDDLTTRIVVKRLGQADCGKGYLLDGFPRTLAQARSLDTELSRSGQKIDLVVYLDAAADLIARRMAGRRMCRKCGSPYHTVTLKPKVEGVCDRCGGELYQRDDDQPETVKDRLRVYEEKTAPLIEYYREQGLLRRVDGGGTVAEVQAQLLPLLGLN